MRKTIIVEKDGNQYLIELDRAAFTCYPSMYHKASLRAEVDSDGKKVLPANALIRGIVLPGHIAYSGHLEAQFSKYEVMLNDLPAEVRNAILKMLDENFIYTFWRNFIVDGLNRSFAYDFQDATEKLFKEYMNHKNPFILSETVRPFLRYLKTDQYGNERFTAVEDGGYRAPFLLMPNAIMACLGGSLSRAGTACTVSTSSRR